jgi:hypothetical protein
MGPLPATLGPVVAVRSRDRDASRQIYLWADQDWTVQAFLTNDWLGALLAFNLLRRLIDDRYLALARCHRACRCQPVGSRAAPRRPLTLGTLGCEGEVE